MATMKILSKAEPFKSSISLSSPVSDTDNFAPEKLALEKLAPENYSSKTTLLQPPSTEPSIEAVKPSTEVLPEAASEEQPKAPKKSPRWRLGLILGALGVGTIAAGMTGYRWWQYASSHEQTDNATVVGHIHNISPRITGTVAAVMVQDNQSVRQGQTLFTLDPRDYQVKMQQAQAALLTAQRQAEVAQSNIAVVSQNAQGQTTQAQGDITGAIASISTAQAALTESQAGVPVARAAVKSAEAGVESAKAQVSQADVNLEKLRADYVRYSSLSQAGAISKQQFESAKAAYNVAQAERRTANQGVRQAQATLAQAQQGVASAQAKVAQAQQGIASAQAGLSKSRGGLQQAKSTALQTKVNQGQFSASEAAIAQAEASLKDAKLQLSYTTITAPTAGIIGRKSVEVGQRVQPGALTMAIVDPNVWVIANFKETQLERMRPGELVEVKLDTFPNHVFSGKLQSVSPASGAQFTLLPPDNATGNFTKIVQRIPVKILLAPQSLKGYESLISPGMSAEVSVSVR
jgi:membrane fusion protein, multidrug efflux system